MPGMGGGGFGGMGGSVGGGMMSQGGGNKADKKKNDEEMPINKPLAEPRKFHKGGKVRKSGWAQVRKGERVLTKKQVKRAKRKRG
jgi:hypothetical protein